MVRSDATRRSSQAAVFLSNVKSGVAEIKPNFRNFGNFSRNTQSLAAEGFSRFRTAEIKIIDASKIAEIAISVEGLLRKSISAKRNRSKRSRHRCLNNLLV
jgi:hypothetical protein